MPRCEGRPQGPCPARRNGNTVRGTQGDLMLCPECDEFRFPSVPYVPVKRNTRLTSAMKTNNSTVKAQKSVVNERKDDGAGGKSTRQSVRLQSASSDQLDSDSEFSCSVCLLPVNNVHNKYIKCSISEEVYHQKCADINDMLFDALTSTNSTNLWTCSECRLNTRSLIHCLQTTVSTMQAELLGLQSKVEELEQHIRQPLNTVSAGEGQKSDRSEVTPTDMTAAKVSMIVHRTLAADERRKKNVVAVGIPETTDMDDKDAFLQICEENLDIKPHVYATNCVRIGQRLETRPRLLLVKLNS